MDPFAWVPSQLKDQLKNKIIEAIAEQAEKLDPGIAKTIRKLSTNAAFYEAYQKAVESGLKRFEDEYTQQDEDIVATMQRDPGFWQSPTVQRTLLRLISRPGAYLAEEREQLAERFEDVFPQQTNRDRVDKAITYLLRCIAEELWTLPGAKEIRDAYSFQFQRISAETAREQLALHRKQLEATALLGESVQRALLQLTDAVEQKLLPAAAAGELPPVRPYQNLIPKNYAEFIGREEEMRKLMRFLSPEYGLNIITVDGIGGVGKTSLALEAAYRCLQASREQFPSSEGSGVGLPTFDAIIFTSAKQDALTAGGILPRHQAQRTLRDIFQEISRTLDRPDIIRATPEEQPKRVRDNLARQQTLLIVDNLETIEDKQGILAFLYELPANVKVVITTRERQSIAPIRLTELPEPQGLQLIRQKAEEMSVTLNAAQAKDLYRVTGGIPAAIIYAVGQIATGYTVQTVIERIRSATSDVARFCFQGSVEPLRGTPAHHLLMAIAIFPKNPVREALATVAGYAADPITIEEGLVRLQRLSLVTQVEERYSLLPLTREYALAELAAYPDFEKEARERWIGWYLQFVQKYGGYEYKEWHIQYDRLDEEWENIQELLSWCTKQEQYANFKNLWNEMTRFTDLYGYWDARLMWIDWLIQASEKRGELSVLVEQLTAKGGTFLRMGQLDKALPVLQEAWNLRRYSNDLKDIIRIAYSIAETLSSQAKYNEVPQWLEQSQSLANNLSLEEERKRYTLYILYRHARFSFLHGNYKQAEEQVKQLIQESHLIDWQRGVVFAQVLLANIKIALRELDQAQHLLETWFPVVTRNKDKQGIAIYKRGFVRLSQACGNYDEMRRWAKEALDDFERLGMIPDADEMRVLLASA